MKLPIGRVAVGRLVGAAVQVHRVHPVLRFLVGQVVVRMRRTDNIWPFARVPLFQHPALFVGWIDARLAVPVVGDGNQVFHVTDGDVDRPARLPKEWRADGFGNVVREVVRRLSVGPTVVIALGKRKPFGLALFRDFNEGELLCAPIRERAKTVQGGREFPHRAGDPFGVVTHADDVQPVRFSDGLQVLLQVEPLDPGRADVEVADETDTDRQSFGERPIGARI